MNGSRVIWYGVALDGMMIFPHCVEQSNSKPLFHNYVMKQDVNSTTVHFHDHLEQESSCLH